MGEQARLENLSVVDTVLVRIDPSAGDTSTVDIYVPVKRSFLRYPILLDSTRADSVLVGIEQLESFRSGDAWPKSNGDYFFIHQGIVDKYFPWPVSVGPDSGMEAELTISASVLPVGNGVNLLVILDDAVPSGPGSEQYTAYGLCDEKLVEFPGLGLLTYRELPRTVTPRKIFLVNINYGCMSYVLPMWFEPDSCSFISNPLNDTVFVASGKADLRHEDDSLTLRVFSSPNPGAEVVERRVGKGSSVVITKYCERNAMDWIQIRIDDKVEGWINRGGIGALGLLACG